jgi:hypothetical protein
MDVALFKTCFWRASMAAKACAIFGSRCSSASKIAFGYSLTVAAVFATASQWYVDENTPEHYLVVAQRGH